MVNPKTYRLILSAGGFWLILTLAGESLSKPWNGSFGQWEGVIIASLIMIFLIGGWMRYFYLASFRRRMRRSSDAKLRSPLAQVVILLFAVVLGADVMANLYSFLAHR